MNINGQFNYIGQQLQSSLRNELQNITDVIKNKINTYVNQGKKVPVEPVKTPSLNIAILSDGGGYSVPKAIKMIEKTTGSKVKPINYHAPRDIDLYDLALEVTTSLKKLEETKLRSSKASRVASFIDLVKSHKLDAPISLKIIKSVQETAKNLDCIFLPGGEDIPPAWYEDVPQHAQEDFYRSLVEFTFLQEAKTKGIPLMGVCRGFQAAYVFNGKQLKTNVPGQYRVVQTLCPFKEDQSGLIGHIFQETVRGQGMHFQGVTIEEGTKDEIDLEPLTSACGLIKAAENKQGGSSPLILTQFHPEFYEPGEELSSDPNRLSGNNAKFINILYDGAKTRNFKRLNITDEALIEQRKLLRKTMIG